MVLTAQDWQSKSSLLSVNPCCKELLCIFTVQYGSKLTSELCTWGDKGHE